MKYPETIFILCFIGFFSAVISIILIDALIELHPITHLPPNEWMNKYEPTLTILILIGAINITLIPTLIFYRHEKRKFINSVQPSRNDS